MKNNSKKGNFVGKTWVKILIITIFALTMMYGLLFINALWGNPIRKQMAKSRCLGYYEDQYHELFIVQKIEYWSKLPGYILILSPESDPQIQFMCNPNCEPLCNSDEYGGKLASLVLVEQIKAILEPSYAHLALRINASEDPYTLFGGENPNFFETDPLVRLTKNHQDLSITWVDPNLNRDDFEHIADDIAGLIESQLPVTNPDLQVAIAVYPDEIRQAANYQTDFFLFPTLQIDD